MQVAQKPRWKMLCELASTEQDPDRLFELVKEINRLIEEELKHPTKASDQNQVVSLLVR
jgi:hypothetical protein